MAEEVISKERMNYTIDLLIAMAVEEIAEERSDITVAKVNVNESPDLATKYGVKNIPTLMVFKNGILTSKAVGYHSKSDLLSIVE